jgi:hypothetical protein
MLDVFALLSVGLFSVSSLAVAVHLLVLARRSGASPELLLGSSFMLTLVGNATVTLVLGRDIGGGELRTHIVQAAGLSVNLGFILAAVFIARVYRRHSTWARVAVWAVSAALLGSQAFTWVMMDPARDYLGVYWLKFALREFVFIWGAVEAFVYYRLMQKRVRHGIADPVVANRFLLWGVASSLGAFMVATFQIGGAMGYGAGIASTLLSVGAWVGSPAALLFWLTFFAPQAYRRWVERHSEFGVHA